ncbi:MAG: hypothetical protein QE271_01330 [Bacteriovoracaceae bacterium]|nr:hypothetical protein [Bacteriovoracaceae bacterium]
MLVKSFKVIVTLLFLSSSLTSYACLEGLENEGIVPKNNLKIYANQKSSNGLTEQIFNKIIDDLSAIYAPVIAERGGKLKVMRKWTDPTVNASAIQKGGNWVVNMYGGLARHDAVTPDAFALVMCHELGHHLGGLPKVKSFFGSRWASNEGQSDYFASSKCIRKYFDAHPVEVTATVPAKVLDKCASVWGQSDDYKICVRGAMAGSSLANLLAILGSKPLPKFDTPDISVVTATNDAHPAAQCRLDTYFQGSLCSVLDTVDFNNKEEKTGSCYVATGVSLGSRPLCWYKAAKIKSPWSFDRATLAAAQN